MASDRALNRALTALSLRRRLAILLLTAGLLPVVLLSLLIAALQQLGWLAAPPLVWGGMLLIGLLVAAASFGLSRVALRAILQPIRALTDAVARAAEGHLEQPAPIGGADELGQLAAVVSRIAARLRESQESFESRLFERTSDLQNTLTILKNTLDQRDRLNAQLRESTVPLIPLVEGIAVVPIVGALDGERIEQLQRNLLQGVERDRLRVVLVDITAVPVVDTQVARALIMVASAAQLMGCRVGLVGIRPEVAQTIVQLGVAFDQMTTHATLQDGLLATLQDVGYRVVQRV